MDHCQDYNLVTDGVIHEGYWSLALGLRGWPAMGEDIIVMRNILIAEQTDWHIHCQHISSGRSVQLIREARQRGVKITGEACPHHFTLTDADVQTYDTNFKMNPPLRSAKDRDAIIEGLLDGTLEILGSDHAPHCDYEKEVEFDYAPFGITGFETELSLSLMQLHHAHKMSLNDLIAKFTIAPARLLNLAKGTLQPGADADITVFDPNREWLYDRDDSASKSKNSPFHGWMMRGKALLPIVGGKVIFREQDQLVSV
jgi:dihydroorotase